MTQRKTIAVCLAGLGAMIAFGAIAWACTPVAYLYPVNPARGPAGSEVTIRGGQFGTGNVEIRWASENGRVLATTTGPEFTTRVTIPDKPEGVHYLVAIARDPADPSRILGRRAEAFQITSNPNSEARAAASAWGDARQSTVEDGGFPAGMVAAIGVVLASAAAGGLVLVAVRHRKAEAR